MGLAAPVVEPDLVIVPDILFFLTGVSFGFAAPRLLKWLPLALPLGLALVTVAGEGLDGTLVLRLAIALAVTALGVLPGVGLDQRGERRGDVGYA